MEQSGLDEASVDGVEPGFRLGFVPGATPAKWARVWRARHAGIPLHLVPVPAADAERAVIGGALDAAILRPPVDRDALHAIPLYEEEPVVVVSREHVLAALEESEQVELADLADEVLLQPADDVLPWASVPGTDGADDGAVVLPGQQPQQVPATTSDAIELVAAGVGVVVVPRSLARLHHRKDVTVRVLAGGPTAPVALAWVIDREDERIEDLIGIVRGRTVNSSRGRPQQERAEREGPQARAGRDGAPSAQRRPQARRPGRPKPPRRGRRR